MARTPQDVTDKEVEVLKALWELGAATSRQVGDRLYPGEGTSKYGTVQVLVERLIEAGWLARQESAGAHTFTATVDRDELIGRRLRTVAEKLCDGSVTPLLTHLVRAQPLSAAQRDELRALIDELDSKGKGRGK